MTTPTQSEIAESLSLPTHSTNRSRPTQVTHLADGGFAGDTLVLTPDGPTAVTDLAAGDRLFALDPTTRVMKPMRLTAVDTVPAPKRLIRIHTRRADLAVAPDHRIPYVTPSTTDVRYQSAAELDKEYYKFVTDWRPRSGRCLSTVDVTDHLDDFEACVSPAVHGHTFRARLPEGCEPSRHNSHMGYYFDAATFKRYQDTLEAAAATVTVHAGPGHRRRPYRFDGDDFLAFIGWFATEGSVYWPETRETAQIKIAQQERGYRTDLAALFDRLGIDVTTNDDRFEFGSALFGRLLERLCGTDSHTKRLPDLVWDTSPRQRSRLLTVLLAGDGNENHTFYTASDRLAGDVLRLSASLGLIPAFNRRDTCWQIYIRDVNDGFTQDNIELVSPPTDDLYRLTVADYHTVLAGRQGRFQWAGVSAVR